MKRTDMEKLAGRRLDNDLQQARSPARFGSGAGAAALSRREQRRQDQAKGLVPFAVKIDAALADRVRALARERGASVDETVAGLLRAALPGEPGAGTGAG